MTQATKFLHIHTLSLSLSLSLSHTHTHTHTHIRRIYINIIVCVGRGDQAVPKMQGTLTFPTLQEEEEEQGSPTRFTFPELFQPNTTEPLSSIITSACCSELSSCTSTPFVSAPSSPTSRSNKAFYFSAPTSPSWPLHSQGFDNFPYWAPQSSSCRPLNPLPLHTHGSRAEHPHSSCSCQTDQHLYGSSTGRSHPEEAEQARFISDWTQESIQAEHNRSSSWHQKTLHSTQKQRPSSWSQISQAEHHNSSPVLPQKPLHAEYERSPDWAQQFLETEKRSPGRAQQRDLQTEPLASQAFLQINNFHGTSSNLTQHPHPIVTDFASRRTLKKRLQVEADTDMSYSRKSFYASAVPFSWEEKPGTPKARSITSEASNNEDDSPSNLLSGSSEFEFSARFSELEEPPMSPTPISSIHNSFKHQYAYGSPSPTYRHTCFSTPDVQSEAVMNEEQIRPLRPPPRLDIPGWRKQPTKDEGNELMHSHGSVASLSVPQSPRSPRIFDIRGVFCGISSPVDAVVDPFLTAMEKSMAKNGDELANEEMGRSPKKKTNRMSHGFHRRTRSLSPLRVFHWDDHSAKSNSSSNGSSNMEEVKNKHPIHREINARHSAGTPKGSRRWSFKGFLHRKSVSGAESARPSNTSVSPHTSLRSSGRESCSSSGRGSEGPMDANYADDNVKIRGANSPSIGTSTPTSMLSPSSSNNSSRGKINPNKGNKGPYALHYSMQRAHTEELRKKTFLPYKQGLLGCLGLSSRSYRALASLSKPLQSVS